MCCTRLAGNTGHKKSPSQHHRTTLSVVSSQLRHVSTIGKNLLNSNSSSTCPHNMVNFGPLTAEISSGVWGTPANFNGLVKLCGVEQRAPPIFGRVAIALGIGPHSSLVLSNSCICHEFSLNTFLPVNSIVYVYHRTVSEFYDCSPPRC